MSPSRYKWIGFSEFQNFCENHHFSEARRYENAPTCKKAASTSCRRWRNASLELLFQTRIRSAKVRRSGKAHGETPRHFASWRRRRIAYRPLESALCVRSACRYVRRRAKSMKGEDNRTCRACGSELSGAMEFCPVCLLREALDAEAESGELSSEYSAKPQSELVARR